MPIHFIYVVYLSAGTLTDPLTQNGYTYASNNPIVLMDPYGMFSMSSAWSGFQSLTGLDKYQSSIAQGCSWGSVAIPGANEVALGV